MALSSHAKAVVPSAAAELGSFPVSRLKKYSSLRTQFKGSRTALGKWGHFGVRSVNRLNKINLFHPVPRKLLSSLCQLLAVLKNQARGGVPQEILLTTVAILKHRTIKILKFPIAIWDPDYIVPSRLWATSLSQSRSRRKTSKTVFFNLFASFLPQFPQTHDIFTFSTCSSSFGTDTNKELRLCWLRGE